MYIGNLNFIETCAACPEQYDVYTDDKRKIGYVRLRWGYLRADYIWNNNDETVYDTNFSDPYGGLFTSSEERIKYLSIIAEKLLERDIIEKKIEEK